ncbi:MAG TPA: M61 family peptidase, partial [Terriglobia bacterium]|nr:M61 family peptidase [Terriglobia bacterium]
RRDDAIAVHLEAPEHWRLSCSLASAEAAPRTLLAPSYDVLIDSPIEIGVHDVIQFDIDGIPHDIVLWGAPSFDHDRLKNDFAAIVRKEAQLFGGLPYGRYIFMLHISPGLGGGTEHLNSTVIHAPPRAFEDAVAYKRLIATASHEVFHVWNVKRLRPRVLAKPDLARENYTDLLWFCEGTTSYYDELILARAGLSSPDEYLSALGELIQRVRRRPGSNVQSLAESSFDAWIKFNQSTADEMNSTVSFYDGGAVVSFLLDLELRARSENRVSLDTLMREMVARFPASEPGFVEADLIATAASLTGSGFEDFFARYIHGTDRPPLEDRVGVVGLQLGQAPTGTRAYTGLILQDQHSLTTVKYALSDGPAYRAGVMASDEIVALNGRRYSGAEFPLHIEQQMKPGEVVQLELIRRGRQRMIEFELGAMPKGRWTLSRVSSPTESQRAAYTDWLHQTW